MQPQAARAYEVPPQAVRHDESDDGFAGPKEPEPEHIPDGPVLELDLEPPPGKMIGHTYTRSDSLWPT